MQLSTLHSAKADYPGNVETRKRQEIVSFRDRAIPRILQDFYGLPSCDPLRTGSAMLFRGGSGATFDLKQCWLLSRGGTSRSIIGALSTKMEIRPVALIRAIVREDRAQVISRAIIWLRYAQLLRLIRDLANLAVLLSSDVALDRDNATALPSLRWHKVPPFDAFQG